MNGQEGKTIAIFPDQEFEFFDGEITDGKAHIYCSGWSVYATDETCDECKACPGWIFGNQCYEDAKNCLKEDK